MINATTISGRMRLLTGDYILDEPYLEDHIYLWFYESNGNSELDGAIEALESIINNIALQPKKWRTGDVWEETQSLGALERRLADLKLRKKGTKVPIIMKSDRKDWDDFTKAFG